MEKSFINNLTNEEIETLHQILIRCATKISNFLSRHPDPKKYSESIKERISTKKFALGLKLFSELSEMNRGLYTRNDLKKLIQGTNKEAANKIISPDYVTDSTLSKIYGEFGDKELFINITGKNEIKNIRTKEFLETGKKKNYKTEGRISFYKKSLEIEKVLYIISKPVILQYITNTLNKFDKNLFEKYLTFNMKAFFYLLPNCDETLELHIKNLSNYYKNIQIDFNYFDKFTKDISSIPEQQIEFIAKKFVDAINKILGFSIIIYILYLL